MKDLFIGLFVNIKYVFSHYNAKQASQFIFGELIT